MISIIMPFKNAVQFLDECLESITKQTERDWELLAVDDSSIDGSLSLVQSWANKDSRIRVYPNRGKGIIDGLQTAYHYAQGNFITRVDADDRIPPNRLSIHKKLLEEAGKGFIATAKVSYFSEQPIGQGYQEYERWLNGLIDQNSHWEELFKECVIPSPCWMMHREDFEKCGGFSGTDYPEDYDLVFRMWEKGIKVVSSKETLLYWREHPGRTSRNDIRLTDVYFSKLKVKYFLRNCYRKNHTLLIWGAGNKAKDIVAELNQKNIPLLWVSANPEKIGKTINSHRIIGLKEIPETKNTQHIISFTDPESQQKVSAYMSASGLLRNQDYFFFA